MNVKAMKTIGKGCDGIKVIGIPVCGSGSGGSGGGGDVSGKEDKSNKVTSLSSASTNTQYPSAKCVYDLVGDVETLLAAI